jgi:hypothetical protein
VLQSIFVQQPTGHYDGAFRPQVRNLERIPVTLKRSLHVGSNWRILAD